MRIIAWSTLHGRTPHGVRGLKYCGVGRGPVLGSRTPHGVRGLKFVEEDEVPAVALSHPSRGAWIEMLRVLELLGKYLSRTPHGVRGLKCVASVARLVAMTSHPSRGAWIEMKNPGQFQASPGRTPHGVRGLKCVLVGVCRARGPVAPLTGCVD